MKKQKKENKFNLKEQGITLVALVVTIIILLILAGVTINIALRENGLFKMSEKVVEKYKEEAGKEEETLQDLEQHIKNNTPVEPAEEPKEPIGKTPYVGYYASRDGITVDGIIYADQAVGNTNGTKWSDGDGTYTIPIKEEGLKEYYISQESYTTEAFGPKPVLTPINDEGEDRFYIMSLEDFGGKGQSYYWYYSAFKNMSDYSTATSTKFGTGKTNTENMVAKWTAGESEDGYGKQDGGSTYKDIWGYFSRKEIPEGWFLPSRGELAAFMQELGINSSNYSNQFQLSSYYWSSSQFNFNYAWLAYMLIGCMSSYTVNYGRCVRLSATF